MDPKGIFEALVSKFGDDVVFGFQEAAVKGCDSHFFVAPERLPEVARHLRDDPKLACDYLECVSGVDYPDAPVAVPPPKAEGEESKPSDKKGTIHVVYHVFSYAKKHRAVMKASLPREAPEVATLTTVWSAANWQERECYDLLGVKFRGHPDLRRIMLPDDWVGHPLRKDYKEQPEYHGIPTTRPNPLELLTELKPKAAPEKKAEAKPAGDKKAEAKPAAEKKADAKPADEKAKPAAEKKAEAKPAAEKKADAKPADEKAKPAATEDAKPADEKAKPAATEDAKPADQKAEAKPAEAKPTDETKAEAKESTASADAGKEPEGK